ncbi:MAG: hypothetical protein VKM92_04975 [Cyanobacteriota bacterium]|nr:hypothetical protein [Cyanobacteriota bacterium]
MTDSATTISISDCLGRTCLKWGADGELTALDLALVMERLAQVDGAVSKRHCPAALFSGKQRPTLFC